MKNIFLLLTIVLVCGGLSSCEDNNDPVWGNAKNAHRITRAVWFEGDSAVCHDDYVYEGDRLISVTHLHQQGVVADDWAPVYKQEMSYLGNQVWVSFSGLEDGSFVEFGRTRYLVSHGLMMEEANYDLEDGELQLYDRYVYEYSGSQLISWKNFGVDDGGVELLYGQGVILYRSGKVVKLNQYGVSPEGERTLHGAVTFLYSSGLMNGYSLSRSLEGNLEPRYKVQYEFASGKMISMTRLGWNPELGDWSDVGDRLQYSYNQFGDLASRFDADYGMEYQYEEGNGNARFFDISPDGLVSGVPTIKSASSSRPVPYYQRFIESVR